MTPRTIAQIKAQMIAEKNAQNDLAGLTSTSQTAIWNLLIYIVAVGISIFENLMSAFETATEKTILSAAPGTDYWIQQKVLEFQYDATTPQVTVIDPVTFAVGYPVVDTTKQIISRASVKTQASKTVSVKVATGEPPAALSTPQLNALKDYLTNGGNGTVAGVGIGFAGVAMNVTSGVADKLFLEATINYNGQYASVIQTNVIAALDAYLANIEFDGIVKITSIVDAIQGVQGVTDVFIKNCAMRADSTALASATYLVLSNTQIYASLLTFAGYIVQETTAGNTFTDKLTFTPNS